MPKLTFKQTAILILVVILIIIGLFLLAITPNQSPFSNISSPTPTVSPSPSAYPSAIPTSPPLESVDLNNLEPSNLPTTSPTLKPSVTKFTTTSAQKFAETLQFTGAPTITKSTENTLVSWNNQNYNLTINLNNSQVVMGNLSNNFIATQNGGFSKNPVDLTKDATSLIQKLNIFDQKLTFIPTTVEYFRSHPTYYEPVTQTEAHLITINLAPQIDNNPIYLENKQFIKATYDQEGKLIKLIINSPLGQVVKTQPIALLNLEDLKKISPDQFFAINISPQNIKEYYLSPPAITSIDPNQIKFGFVLKPSQPILTPVFIVEKLDNNHLRYQFAVNAVKP